MSPTDFLNDIYFGDFWGPLRKGYLRCALFQFGGLPTSVREAKEHEFFCILRRYKINLAFLQELGLNWSALSDSQQWRRRVDPELDPTQTKTRCCHNTKAAIAEPRQWGGTGMLAHGLVSHFAAGSGADKSGLGRWTWSRFSGKNGTYLRCVSFYRPCKNRIGSASVWSQHKAHFQLQNDDRDPCLAFYADFHKEIQEWIQAGDQLFLGGDINDHAVRPVVAAFFTQLGLHNLIFERHSQVGAPTTSFRNEQGKILDSFWGTANISVTQCGYCHPKEFLLGGHSVVWMDISYASALGHYPPVPHTFQARRLRLDRPKTVKSYQDRHLDTVHRQSLLPRQFNLENSITLGVPLTAAQALEAECLDDLRTNSMNRAQRKCRHLFKGGVDFSSTVAAPKARLEFWILVISRRKGVKIKSRRIRRQKKAAQIRCAIAQMDMTELEKQLRLARKDYKQAKVDHKQHRRSFIATFPPKIQDRIQRTEAAREQGRMARLITGKLESKKVTSVLHQGQTYDTKQGIDQVLLPINEAKVRSSEDTAFRIHPLVQVFGDRGNLAAEDAVLAGTCQPPPGTSRGATLFLRHAKQPPGIVDSPLGISTEDHISAMKKAKERTTGGRSGLHVGMFKANSKIPALAQLDASMRSLSQCTGYSYHRSKTCADVQLRKRSGNINAEEHRTICVSEIDSNTNFKLMGKQAMWKSERLGVLARDNLGGRKGMRPVEVSMNQRLLYDLI